MNSKVISFSQYTITFLLIIIFHLPTAAQINYCKEFHRLSCPEKRWVLFHPFVAKKTFRLSLKAREAANQLLKDSLLDKDANGGQIDAWRHAYWMALLSQHICWRKAWRLGKAHEKGNFIEFKKRKTEEGALPDSISGAMDLFNNKIGIDIGRSNKKLPEEELKKAVRDSVLAGRMLVIRKNEKGEALDCEGNKIDLLKYNHQWNIPKCLVKSDYRKE